ncbi:MAG TPA: putative PEP-binding protein [Candidatus Saccharimonadales bacterium]|nr:putative PEP-binding protein [Candidatus Saccharimonadales bacterium]
MTERVLAGVPASPGTAFGLVRRLDDDGETDAGVLDDGARPAAASRALDALARSAHQLDELAAGLRSQGRTDEADILDAGMMMAEDPVLVEAVESAVLTRGLPAASAIRVEAEAIAARLDLLGDPELAARAADVRSLARRASRLASGDPARADRSTDGDTILVASDLGPADVIELDGDVRGIALAVGGVTGHAAIVARGLGLPMVVGLGPAILSLAEGERCIVDGDRSTVIASPDPERVDMVRQAIVAARESRDRALAARTLPTVTRDGRTVRVLANAATPAEVRAALEAGADGVGLLRTELAFLEAQHWPTVAEHRRTLNPALAQLKGMTATVRLLDFGGDKTPPFLKGVYGRGVELLLEDTEALAWQLEAILETGDATELRVLIPMVTEPGQVRAVRAVIEPIAARRGKRVPVVAAMVEVPAAAAMADRIAPEVGMFSIGTNDLTSFQLGIDRTRPGGSPAHHPAVLQLVADTVDAARAAGIPVEICGEAASNPVVMPLLVGLGVDELSVGAAAVARVRAWVRALDYGEASRIARRALEAESAAEVESLERPLRLLLDDAG